MESVTCTVKFKLIGFELSKTAHVTDKVESGYEKFSEIFEIITFFPSLPLLTDIF